MVTEFGSRGSACLITQTMEAIPSSEVSEYWTVNTVQKYKEDWQLINNRPKNLQICLILLPGYGDLLVSQNLWHSFYVKYDTMDNVQIVNDSECDTPLSERYGNNTVITYCKFGKINKLYRLKCSYTVYSGCSMSKWTRVKIVIKIWSS
jgi:hypothetical protein